MNIRFQSSLIWALIIILIGILLLLENTGVISIGGVSTAFIIFGAFFLFFLGLYFSSGRPWGLLVPTFVFLGLMLLVFLNNQPGLPSQVGAGALVFCIGVPFLLAFVIGGSSQWWGLIPGGILAFIGLAVALSGYLVESFVAAIILWGFGLAFLLVFLAQRQNWWALIPGGTLITIGFLPPMINYWGLSSAGWVGGVFCAGLAATFGLVFLANYRFETRWALYPFGLLLLVAACFFIFGELAARWWPVIFILVGLYILLRTISWRKVHRG